MDMNSMTSSTTIAMQEDAMWAEHFAKKAKEEADAWDQYHLAEQQALAQSEDSADTVEDCEANNADSSDADHYGRFMVTGTGPSPLYPTDDKKQHTSKDRRYVHLVKTTDRGKALGKTPGKKGKSYRQLKQEGIPLDNV